MDIQAISRPSGCDKPSFAHALSGQEAGTMQKDTTLERAGVPRALLLVLYLFTLDSGFYRWKTSGMRDTGTGHLA